jgi:hypothetical protein
MGRFRLRPLLGPVAVLLTVVAMTYAMAACGSSGAKPTSRPSGPQPPAWLSALAYREARLYQDPHPTSAIWVLTTYSVVERVTHFPSAHKPPRAYLVVEYGHFVDTMSSRPPGMGDFHGTMLYFDADPKTHVVFDYGIGPAIPLSPLIANEVKTLVPSLG